MKYYIENFSKINDVDIKIIENMENNGYFKCAGIENGKRIYLDTQIPAFKLAHENFCLKGLDKVVTKEYKTELLDLNKEECDDELARAKEDRAVKPEPKKEPEKEEDFQKREEFYENIEDKQQEIIDKITEAKEKQVKKEKKLKEKRKKEQKRRQEIRHTEEERKRENSSLEEHNKSFEQNRIEDEKRIEQRRIENQKEQENKTDEYNIKNEEYVNTQSQLHSQYSYKEENSFVSPVLGDENPISSNDGLKQENNTHNESVKKDVSNMYANVIEEEKKRTTEALNYTKEAQLKDMVESTESKLGKNIGTEVYHNKDVIEYVMPESVESSSYQNEQSNREFEKTSSNHSSVGIYGNEPDELERRQQQERENRERINQLNTENSYNYSHGGGKAKVGQGHLVKDIDYSVHGSSENTSGDATKNTSETINKLDYDSSISKSEETKKESTKTMCGTGTSIPESTKIISHKVSSLNNAAITKNTSETINKPDYDSLINKSEETKKESTTTLYGTGTSIPESTKIISHRVSALNNAAMYSMSEISSGNSTSNANNNEGSFFGYGNKNIESGKSESGRINSTTNLRHAAIASTIDRISSSKRDAMSIPRGDSDDAISFDLKLKDSKRTNGRLRSTIGNSAIDFYGVRETSVARFKQQIYIASGSTMALASRRGISATYASLIAKSSRINSEQLLLISIIFKEHHLAGEKYGMLLKSKKDIRDALTKFDAYAKQRGFKSSLKLNKKQFDKLIAKNAGRLTTHDKIVFSFYKENMLKLAKIEGMSRRNALELKNTNFLMVRQIFGKLEQFDVAINTKRFAEAGLRGVGFAVKTSRRALKALKNVPLSFRMKRLKKITKKQNQQMKKLKKAVSKSNTNKVIRIQSKQARLKEKADPLRKKVNKRLEKDFKKRELKLKKRENSLSSKLKNKFSNNRFTNKISLLKRKFSNSKVGSALSIVGKVFSAPFKAFNFFSELLNKIKLKIVMFLGLFLLVIFLIAAVFDIAFIAITSISGFFMKSDGSNAETIQESVVYDIVTECNDLNAQWVNWIYDLKNVLIPPEDSYTTESKTMHDGTTIPAVVLGHYDDIEVHFVDSFTTRTPISLINNTKQIICMASVYFENDLSSDVASQHMMDYVTQLWKDSHIPNQDTDVASNYGIYYETSDVYYCDGCKTYYCDGSCNQLYDTTTGNYYNGVCPGETYCPGHVDVHVYATVYGFEEDGGNEGTNMFNVDSYASENGGDNWLGWGEKEGNKDWAELFYSQDWKEMYDIDLDSVCVWDTPHVSSGNGSRLSDDELNTILGYAGNDETVAYALSRIGQVTYVFGAGHGADYKTSNLLDCSSFVCQVLANTGHDIGIKSTAGLATSGIGVSVLDIHPGDVVVRRNGESGHTGIYIGRDGNGNYLVVHNSGTGINVIVSSYPNLISWNNIRRIS